VIQPSHFSSMWIVVAAVEIVAGEILGPVALAATEAHSDVRIVLDMPELRRADGPPYPTDAQTLLVTIDGQHLAAVHLALGWRMPERLLDLLLEHRNAFSDHSARCVGGLAGALLSLAQPSSEALAVGPTHIELQRRLSAVRSMLDRLGPQLDLGRALLRGRYLCAVAKIEATGVPVDREVIGVLAERWGVVKASVIQIIDRDYGVYRSGHLNATALMHWLARRGIPWPRLPSGHLDLRDDAFRDMSRAYPAVRPLKEVRTTLTVFDPSGLAIGSDGRNRVPLKPFASRTGRNQPSAKASVLGTAAWVRHLILPQTGTGLALVDWSQQEFGIAAALSGDAGMQQAYSSGDPYLALAVMAGAVSPSATSTSHAHIRARYKLCALGIQYGMGAATLARLTGRSESEAKDLQHRHRKAFRRFWRWSEAIEEQAYLTGQLSSVFGWRLGVSARANPRMLRNFPLQANGAEMLRVACCLATEDRVPACGVRAAVMA